MFPKGSPKLKITDKIKDKKNQLKPSFLVDNIYKYYLTQPILNYPKFLTKYFYLIILIIFSFLSTFFLPFPLSLASFFLYLFFDEFLHLRWWAKNGWFPAFPSFVNKQRSADFCSSILRKTLLGVSFGQLFW